MMIDASLLASVPQPLPPTRVKVVMEKQLELADPPTDPRALELWLQHAAGKIIWENVRGYAERRIDPALSNEARDAAQKAVDHTVGGLMMVIDGVTGSLSNATHSVFIDFIVRLAKHQNSCTGDVISQVNLRNGDGMCMGYHSWRDGDFGKDPVVKSAPVPSSS